jgi:hypothetical protein
VVEAKSQAEQAQGVGQELDVAVLSEDGRTDLDDSELEELRETHEGIVKAEREARERKLEESNYTFSL